ncbi:MAG: hypothetical protein RIT28_4953, partial [Pseudomonadota bacterium]
MPKPDRSPDRPLRRPKVRLSALKITDYKAIDHLDLSLPTPTLPGTPDVYVLGSKNGVGKTSVLECAALAMLGAVHPRVFDERWESVPPPYDQLIRAGAASATIVPTLEFEGQSETPTNALHPTKLVPGDVPALSAAFPPADRSGDELNIVESLLGRASEPLLLPPVLVFHSYRKVAEGRVELSALVEPHPARRHGRDAVAELSTISAFKITLIRALMQQSGLFEARAASPVTDETLLTKLNSLISRYAGGAVKKLGASTDNRIDLRITPNSGGASYSFDGLSSGQKEIIATMFLI